MNDEKSLSKQTDHSIPEIKTSEPSQKSNHTIATGLGAASGGIAGAALGKSVAGRGGAAVGGVVGAIAGSLAGEALMGLAGAAKETLGLGFGADNNEVELPPHYSWEELQALSKPQAPRLD
jgi:outer membrane lipoprotein SlyB